MPLTAIETMKKGDFEALIMSLLTAENRELFCSPYDEDGTRFTLYYLDSGMEADISNLASFDRHIATWQRGGNCIIQDILDRRA